MCELCHYSICPSSCPNAPDPPIFAHCHECGEEIYDGDEYFEIDGHSYCEACVYKGYRTAEVEYDSE